MCMHCRDLDDYDRRHGHQCGKDEDCQRRCDECEITMCALSEDDEDRPYYLDGVTYCRQHFEKNRFTEPQQPAYP